MNQSLLVNTRRVIGARAIAAFRFFLIVTALHLPSWLIGWFMGGPRAEERPLFNLDLLLAAAVACTSTLGGAVVLVLAWAADILRAAARNFHFMSTLDFVDAARFLRMLNVGTFLSPTLFASVLGLLACMVTVLTQTRRDKRQWLPLLVTIVATAGLDIANGSFHIFGLEKDSRLITMNFAGSPLWNVGHDLKRSPSALGAPMPFAEPVTFQEVRDWQFAHPRGSSVLVLVESMGLPLDPGVLGWLTSTLNTHRLQARWRIRQSEEGFQGSTTYGELRTLCGLQVHYSRLDDQLSQSCLPRQLAAMGVTSSGIHGFGLRMFDRHEWWPRIGLLPWQWSDAGLPMGCNRAFPGVCDRAVIARAVQEAQQPAHFVYALTLDTHLPLDVKLMPPPQPELKTACDASGTSLQACRLVQRLGGVLSEVEGALASSKAAPLVVVVGDHAPPFGEQANLKSFAPDKVVMFTLTPREEDRAARAH